MQSIDWRTGKIRSGKVVELKSNQVTVHDDGTRSHRKPSYAGIDFGGRDERIESSALLVSRAPVHKPAPEDFRGNKKVSFTDKFLQHEVGTVARINQRTATGDCEGAAAWRVSFAMLRHVMDI